MERQREQRRLRECMQHSLREYGVASHGNQSHAAFSKTVMKEVIQQADATSDTFPLLFQSKAMKKNDLPRDQVEAIKHVLRADLKGAIDEDGVEIVEDDIGVAWPPFYKLEKYGRVVYKQNNGYEHVSAKDLENILNRFTFVTVSDRRYLYDNWNDRDCLGGLIVEALVANHVVYSEACYHCHFRNCLRWNGGRDTDSSWADLLCLKCHSTYEIKSKRDAAALEKVFKHKELRGGSFRLFHANRSEGKRYLVLVSRKPSDRGEYPVSIRDIHAVEPVLKDASFAAYLKGSKLSIGTRVRIKEQNVVWCCVPCPSALTFKIWAQEVFDEHFGDRAWDAEACSKIPKKEEAPSTESAKLDTHKEKDLEALKLSLEQLCVDDWDASEDEDEAV